MASTTTNIGLTKPAGTDQALISAINGNMDIIDTKMGAVGNTSVQGQINALSDQIAIYDLTSSQNLKSIAVDNTICKPGSVKWLNLRNASSSGLPNNNSLYSLARVNKRNANNIRIDIYTESGPVWYASTADGGTTWSDWVSLSDQMTNLLKKEAIPKTISESIGAGVSKSYTFDVSKTGYTPIGIIQQTGSGTASFAFQDAGIAGNTATVYVRNVSGSSATLNSLTITVLYVLNGFI